MPPEVIDRPVRSPRAAAHDSQHLCHSIEAIELSIVIVNWNTRTHVRNCLESIDRNLGRLRAEVIVIENASTDGSADMIETEFPHVQLIRNQANRGFAAANNQGMRIARGRYVLLLNSDTIVIDDVFERCIDFAEANPDAGVIGCQVLEQPEVIQRTCFRYPSPFNTLMWVTGLSAWLPYSRLAGWAQYGPWQRRNEQCVDVISGMFMLVRREALQDVGFMDEDYFVFAEEADWCFRFRRAGWKCIFAPVGQILHVDGGSKSTEQVSVKMYVEMQKNILIFHRKNLGLGSWTASKGLFLFFMIGRAIWWSIIGFLAKSSVALHKAQQSRAAVRFHWTGVEPPW